jgi:hypothetical protein
MRVATVVVASSAFLPHYKVLYQSIRKYIPEATTLLYYGGEDNPTDVGDVVSVKDWTRHYDDDWSDYCSLRPRAIMDAFSKGYDKVILLGADTEFFCCPTELISELTNNTVVFTPYTLEPLGNEINLYPHDGQILAVGQMNADCIGFRNSKDTVNFLIWMDKVLETGIKYDNRLVLDQYYWNYAFSLLDNVKVLRHRGYNVQYIRANEMRDDVGYWQMKDGSSLVLFHYAGYNGNNSKMSKHQTRYTAIPIIEKFYEEYGRKLSENR